MNSHLRQTGRTTRLVEKACHAARNGRAVYLIVDNPNEAKRITQEVQAAWLRLVGPDAPTHGIKVEAFAEHALGWSWERMTPGFGFHPNCLWLCDHLLVERQIVKRQEEIEHLAKLVGALYPHTV